MLIFFNSLSAKSEEVHKMGLKISKKKERVGKTLS
jgi:hypothetical protein